MLAFVLLGAEVLMTRLADIRDLLKRGLPILVGAAGERYGRHA
jgi:hypothetical protein